MPEITLSKKILTGIGTVLISFATGVFAYVNQRVDDKVEGVKEYVDVKHTAVEDKLNKIESILMRIDDRIYQLNQRGK